jgi:FKBP-type peptidyl-prolyl cis-trans isomerase 2
MEKQDSNKRHGAPEVNRILAAAAVISLLILVFLWARLDDRDRAHPNANVSVIPAAGSNSTGSTPAAAALKAVRQGDVVEVDYVGGYPNGSVFDASRSSIAQKAGIYNPDRAYNPLVFTVGLKEVITGVEEAVVGMKAGEEKVVKIPPEKGYGVWRPEKAVNISRMQNVSRLGDVSLGLLQNLTGRSLAAGDSVRIPGLLWNMTIIEVNDDVAFFRHDPANGTIAQVLLGNSTLTVVGDRIYAFLEVKPGDRLTTGSGYIRVLEVYNDTLTVDLNHELAGQTLVFDLKLISINKVTDPRAKPNG